MGKYVKLKMCVKSFILGFIFIRGNWLINKLCCYLYIILFVWVVLLFCYIVVEFWVFLWIVDGDIDKILIINDWSFYFVLIIVLVFIVFICFKFEYYCV